MKCSVILKPVKRLNLTNTKCVPCSGSEQPLSQDKIELYSQAVPDWTHININGADHLTRDIKLKDFMETIGLVNKIATLAEAEGHHPNLNLHDYNHLEIDLYTHKIKGLHENDFILAQKIDQIFKR